MVCEESVRHAIIEYKREFDRWMVLSNMLKTALYTNIIPHIWKSANIIPIPNLTKT